MGPLMPRDERETSVDLAADRLAYLVLSFGSLAIVAYRSFVDHEPSWDLLGLVVLSGAVGTAHRWRQRVVNRRWESIALASVAVALVVGVIIALAPRP
ncbi:MAG: hypothetical protein ACXWQ6_11840 [Candidatus Limnocylindrales bacterium]